MDVIPVQNTTTPGNGDERGFAFSIAANGTISHLVRVGTRSTRALPRSSVQNQSNIMQGRRAWNRRLSVTE
jgi:hypothetical protein